MSRFLPARSWPIALLLAVLALSACNLAGPDERKRESFKSSAEDYSYNAQQYYHQGDYPRARDQWSKLIEEQPQHWKGRLGIAYCDTQIAVNQIRRGAIEDARKRLQESEVSLRSLWGDRALGGSARANLNAEREPWKAVLGLALNLRAQGFADEVEARILTNRLRALALDAPDREKWAREATRLRQRKIRSYESALALFEQLMTLEDYPPVALQQAGQLQIILGRSTPGEARMREWLGMAESTRENLQSVREESFEELFTDTQSLADANRLMDERLSSNERKQLTALLLLSELAFREERYEIALQDLERAHKLKPSDLNFLVRKAQCQKELGDFEAAANNLETFIEESAAQGVEANDDLARAYAMLQACRARLGSGGR